VVCPDLQCFATLSHIQRNFRKKKRLKINCILIFYTTLIEDHWGDLGVDGWIILGWISRRWDVDICTGLGWPRIGTGGGRL